jgi:teichoic acid transport system permease protein
MGRVPRSGERLSTTYPEPGAGPPDAARELAERYGLEPSSHRPALGEYLSQIWARRAFITSFAQAKMTTMYSQARLGQVWQILTPLLNASVYYFVFGKLLGAHRNIPNYIGFLVTGVMIFTFINRSITNGAKAIPGNLSLIRALHFPRACMPLATVLVEFQQMLLSMVVLVVIVLLSGEPITLRWLMLIPTLACLTLFASGMTMLIARLGANLPDVSQLLPFILRTWLYLSGVFYNIDSQTFTKSKPYLGDILFANPATVYIELARASLLETAHVRPHAWAWAVFWGVAADVVGFVFFWRGEHSYGRG